MFAFFANNLNRSMNSHIDEYLSLQHCQSTWLDCHWIVRICLVVDPDVHVNVDLHRAWDKTTWFNPCSVTNKIGYLERRAVDLFLTRVSFSLLHGKDHVQSVEFLVEDEYHIDQHLYSIIDTKPIEQKTSTWADQCIRDYRSPCMTSKRRI
jgi:hypothetical protein